MEQKLLEHFAPVAKPGVRYISGSSKGELGLEEGSVSVATPIRPRRRSLSTASTRPPPILNPVATYLLAVLGGNTSPTAEDLKDILASVGADSDEDNKIEKLLNSVKGKDITELITAGREKLASVPSGGGGGIATALAAPAAEAKKLEKAMEKEESDDDMGFSLFD